jgi:hypothetical protein
LTEDACEGFRHLRRVVADLKVEDAPSLRLVGRGIFAAKSVNLADHGIQIIQASPDTHTL